MSPFNFRRIGIDQFSETALIVTHAARRQPRCRLIEGAVYLLTKERYRLWNRPQPNALLIDLTGGPSYG
jgi:hypothetical protein